MAILHNLDPDLLFLIGGYLLYNVVISGVQHQKSVIDMCVCVCMCVYIYSLPLEPHSHSPPFLKGNCLDFCIFSLLNKQRKYFVKVIQILLGF